MFQNALSLTAIAIGVAVPTKAGCEFYVFGSYVLDMIQGSEYYAPPYVTAVAKCDSEQYFCIRTEMKRRKTNFPFPVANFVVPKTCVEIKPGMIWARGDIKTRVIATKFSEDGYVLATDGQNNVIFEYTPEEGIYALRIGRADEDVVSMVGRGEDWRKAASLGGRRRAPVSLAECIGPRLHPPKKLPII